MIERVINLKSKKTFFSASGTYSTIKALNNEKSENVAAFSLEAGV